MFKKILIPLDGSLRSELALGLAHKLFQTEDVELILIEAAGETASTYPIYGGVGDGFVHIVPEYNRAQVEEYIEDMADEAKSWAPKVRGFSLLGSPDDAIIKVAKGENVDLIVMFTHDYDAFERLLLGSVTEKVIRDAPCPVLAIRDDHVLNHMLIALDGSPFSETILDPAFELAYLIKADVTLARVDTPADAVDIGEINQLGKVNRRLAETVMVQHSGRSEFYLDDIRQRYLKDPSAIDIKIDYDVDYGKPGLRLAQMADRHQVDLIAMATHGRKGFERIFNRSVTEDVMHRTDTAMLILHPDE